MFTARRERKKEKTRSELIDSAVGLFRKKGFNETSIDDILSQADISKGTLYNYFRDKESILAAYFQQKIAGASDNLKTKLLKCKHIEAQLGVLLDFMHQVLADDMALASIYFRYRLRNSDAPFDSAQRSGMEGLLVEIVRTAQAAHEIRADVPPTIIARNLQFLFSLCIFSAQTEEPAARHFDKARVIELFLHGASAR